MSWVQWKRRKALGLDPVHKYPNIFENGVFFNVAYSNRFSPFTRKRRAPSGQFLQWQRVKIAHIVEFATSKFFTLNDFFHLLGLNWSLNDVKHTNLVFQTQLVSTKHFLIYTHFAVGGKGLKTAYFHPSLCKIPTSSKQHTFSDQLRECPKNIET